MKLLMIVVVLAAMTTRVHADAFEFSDVEGFEGCMQLDHLVETVRTGNGSQTRFLSEIEIQIKCIAAASQLLARAKKKDAIMPFIGAVKRLSAPVNALPLIDLVTRVSLPSCDDSENYDVLAAALELPGEPGGGYVARAKPIVVRCLKDKAFQKDLIDELGSREKNLAAHACDILLEQKLVKSCKGSKP